MGVREEFSLADLGDERLNQRLLHLADCFESRHGESILTSCRDWKTSKSAYRFFDNSRFGEFDIIAPHFESSRARIQKLGEPVLVVHDSTEFNYTHHRETEGLGYLTTGHKNKEHKELFYTEGILMHSSLAMTTDGIPLGLLHQKQWCREYESFHKIRGSGINHSRVPIEEKESYKWIEGVNCSCKGLTPENMIHICDRDADVYELFDHCKSLGTHFVVRAVHSRGTTKKGVKSFSKLSRIPSQGNYTLKIQSSQKRKARVAKIQVRFYKVTLIPPIAKSTRYKPIDVYVVSAKEAYSKDVSDKERINWKILTDLSVESFEQAMQIIEYYQARWNIEIYFKTLKSGFGAERSRLRSASRIKKFISFISVLAWRVFWLTRISRAAPEQKPSICLSKQEISVLTKIEKINGRKLLKSQGLKEFVVAIARLGGYLARNSDPPPGNIVIWRGLMRLNDITMLAEE
jgi:hypothetical protein